MCDAELKSRKVKPSIAQGITRVASSRRNLKCSILYMSTKSGRGIAGVGESVYRKTHTMLIVPTTTTDYVITSINNVKVTPSYLMFMMSTSLTRSS